MAHEETAWKKKIDEGSSEKIVQQPTRQTDDAKNAEKMAQLYQQAAARKEAERKKAEELDKIAVSEEDAELVARELALPSKDAAKRAIRAKQGNIQLVLREYVGLPKKAVATAAAGKA